MLDYENLKSSSLTSSERGAALAATGENANQELRVQAVMVLVDALNAARAELERVQAERDAMLEAAQGIVNLYIDLYDTVAGEWGGDMTKEHAALERLNAAIEAATEEVE